MKSFSAYDNALMFDNAFDLLYEQYQKGMKTLNYLDVGLVVPVIVNGLLACELFLKALINSEIRGS